MNNTSDVQIWNNSFVGNGRNVNLVQDNRRARNLSTPGHDPRRPLPDPTVTWLLGPVDVINNVIALPTSAGNCLLCVEDYSKERSAAQIGVRANANLYNRATVTAPRWAVVWSRGPGNPEVFTDLASFRSRSGQEQSGRLVTGSGVVTQAGALTGQLPAGLLPQRVPPAVAAAVGPHAAQARTGAWR